VHNLFKLPVPILDTSCCNVAPNSIHATFLRELDLILIDEASMIPNHALHAIDRMLRDILSTEVPFGGKLILLGGDFRQVLPVVPRGSSAAIIEQCLKRSPLWSHITSFNLTQNMRALPEEHEFANWLLQLGNGTLASDAADAPVGYIDIPVQCLNNEPLIDIIFPDFDGDRTSHVILTPKNDSSLQINDQVLTRLPGVEYVLLSHDQAGTDNDDDACNYPP
jgi:hypothetical protein